MIFNSIPFVIFLPIAFLIYWLIGHKRTKVQNIFLLVASYFFYGWWDWRFLGLIFLTTLMDYWLGIRISHSPTPSVRKILVVVSVFFNLMVLAVLKYFNFFWESFQCLAAVFGFETTLPIWKVLLPAGISFYTFQSMAYIIDIYRREIDCEYDFIRYATFVAYFPQLVAGPIGRAKNLLPQIRKLGMDRLPTVQQIREGVCLVLWGYFLKVFIADNMARIVDVYFSVGREQTKYLTINPPDPFIFDNPNFSPILSQLGLQITSPEICMFLLAFAIQIYGDFAGYSNIARGIAKFFGVELMVNFRQPYLAQNPSDFWQRWHISLSSWFRDYLYIPLGGNRVGGVQKILNLGITMFLAGLWHGATWTFVLWGFYHAVLLGGYHGLRMLVPLHRFKNKVMNLLSKIFMFVLTLYGWLIFRSKNFAQLKYFTEQLLHNFRLPAAQYLQEFQIRLFWVLLFFIIVMSTDIILAHKKTEYLFTFTKPQDYFGAIVVLFFIIMFGGQSEAFIYFRF